MIIRSVVVGHTETIYSWHEYLPGWAWTEYLTNLTAKNYPGSPYHFWNSILWGNQPNINAECGNVWGYDGSTGDVDWSLITMGWWIHSECFPKMAGWLYTEHHDVINEWNGYWGFDRTNKIYRSGKRSLPGMSLKDLHSDVYLSTEMSCPQCNRRWNDWSPVIPFQLYFKSFLSKQVGPFLYIRADRLTTGMTSTITTEQVTVTTQPWDQKELPPLKLNIPDIRGLALLKLYLKL